MSNCIQCGAENPPSKSNRKRKYCSKKCANDYHHKKNSTRRPGWGQQTIEREKAKKERADRLKWLEENWIHKDEVAKMHGISAAAVHAIAWKKGIQIERCHYNPEDVPKFKPKEVVIPDGHISSKEACELLGCSKSTWDSYNKTDLKFIFIEGTKNNKKFYLEKDVITWNEKRLENRALEVAENKRIRTEASKRRKEERRLETQKRIAERKTRIAKRKERESIEKEERMEERRNRPKAIKFQKRKDDYTSIDAYEEKLFKIKIPKLIASGKYHSIKTGLLKDSFTDAVAINEKWHKNRITFGLVKVLGCKTCRKVLPYTSFLFAKTGRGRQKICKECHSIRNKSKYNPVATKARWERNYVQKIRTIIGTQIKRDLGMHLGSYQKDLAVPDIWEHIEDKLGYDAETLCQHLESQFDAKMNWSNHGRGNDKYHWQIDHIKPRVDFKYTSLDDPLFYDCWNLENMRPLDAKTNQSRHYNK